jgi:hypothetical protein
MVAERGEMERRSVTSIFFIGGSQLSPLVTVASMAANL